MLGKQKNNGFVKPEVEVVGEAGGIGLGKQKNNGIVKHEVKGVGEAEEAGFVEAKGEGEGRICEGSWWSRRK